MIRAVFLGQKWIGERCFEHLLAHPAVDVRAAVTNVAPTTWWRSHRVAERARELRIPVLANDRRATPELEELIRAAEADVLVSVQHPWIVPQSILDAVGGRAFNLHCAKLPDYRGHNAVNHAILNGDSTYTVTVHWMAAEADTGAIAFEETLDILPRETARGLYQRALDVAERLFSRFLEALVADPESVPRRAMAPGGAFYPRSSIDGEREVRPGESPEQVDRRVRALYFPPFEPAFVTEAGTKQYLLPPGFSAFATEFEDATW